MKVDADLRARFGRSRQPQEDAEPGRAAAPGDHRLGAYAVSGDHVEPALVVVARQVADELAIDVNRYRVRVVRVVRLANELRDFLDANLLVADAAAQLQKRIVVVRSADDADELITFENERLGHRL